ncbi:mucin-3A-like [Hyperolius riggenbachi]|uniref:mucin-3A-like n=1 Tax=Hyperolius riggenbachi TaxID=752182 RepID=UPI0035A28B0F
MNSTEIRVKNITETDMCLEAETIAPEMRPYFSGLNRTTSFHCVTRCSPNSLSPIDCHRGQCSVSNQGPHCYCEMSDQYWYTGSYCETTISKPGVIAGVTVGLFLLLIIVVLVTALCGRRRAADRETLVDPHENKNWCECCCWERNLQIQGRMFSPGSSGTFKITQEKMDSRVPPYKMPLPRPRVRS